MRVRRKHPTQAKARPADCFLQEVMFQLKRLRATVPFPISQTEVMDEVLPHWRELVVHPSWSKSLTLTGPNKVRWQGDEVACIVLGNNTVFHLTQPGMPATTGTSLSEMFALPPEARCYATVSMWATKAYELEMVSNTKLQIIRSLVNTVSKQGIQRHWPELYEYFVKRGWSQYLYLKSKVVDYSMPQKEQKEDLMQALAGALMLEPWPPDPRPPWILYGDS